MTKVIDVDDGLSILNVNLKINYSLLNAALWRNETRNYLRLFF